MNIVLLGPPGAGKGTQASYIVNKFGLAKLSTGDMLRAAVDSGNDFGKSLQETMSSGKLVDDKTMVALIKNRIIKDNCANGFVLDGFPRTITQAESLNKMLKDENKTLNLVLELKVDDKIIIDRISGRFSCDSCSENYHSKFKPLIKNNICDICGSSDFSCRIDDNAETVTKRLKSYHLQTAPLLPYYKAKNILFSINGMESIEIVQNKINKYLSDA